MYFVQHWFNLADEACEEARLDSVALRRFVGVDPGRERILTATHCRGFAARWSNTVWALPCLPRSGKCCWTLG
jgi:IS5 family transposase